MQQTKDQHIFTLHVVPEPECFLCSDLRGI